MMRRRRFKQTTTLAERLTQQADRLRDRAGSLSPGPEQTLLGARFVKPKPLRASMHGWAPPETILRAR